MFIFTDGEHEFLDLNEKLSKLAKFAPHLWKDDVSCLLRQMIFYCSLPDTRLSSLLLNGLIKFLHNIHIK